LNPKEPIPTLDSQPASAEKSDFGAGWLRFFGEARTRILVWYTVLMLLFILITLPLARQRLFARVNERVRSELAGEVKEFQQLLESSPSIARPESSQLPDQVSGAPQTREELSGLFEEFMSRELPEDDTFFVAIMDQKIYKSSPRAIPKDLQLGSELMNRLAILTKPEQGEQQSSNSSVGSIIYTARPIRVQGQVLAVFVVAHATNGERSEALEALQVLTEVLVVAFIGALIFSWLLAGRVLQPLRSLTTTAQAISETDLTQRLIVRGNGEIAELAKTFNEMMDRLESAFESQRQFVNNAGHELRTPITIVRGHLELMDVMDDEQTETVALVMDELERMNRLVEDLLLLSKTEQPDFLLLETVNLEHFTQEIFSKATALGDRNWQLDSEAHASVILDRQRLTQALINLAQNAVQHTQPSDKISLGSKVEGDKIFFWVQDTGEGIAMADQQRIFERFARAAKSRRRSEGSGLGLAIVRAIVEAHNGNIKLQSQVGTGSTFTIVLPLEPSTEIRHLFLKYASNPDS
jgi:signal transduction histidine kinase